MQPGHLQESLSSEEPLKTVKEGRGKHFDAALLDLSIEHLDRIGIFIFCQ
jgi:HD-GYP domain-containing protein (c-di-GMP phosphodiesterase class II)